MKALKQKSLTVVITILAALLFFASSANIAFAQCIVKVEAPAQVDPATSFTISIIAEEIPDQNGGMAGWQLILLWNNDLVNCTGETINTNFWPDNSGPLIANPINNATGKYNQALALRSPSTPVTGTYWLVNLTFVSGAPPDPTDTDLNVSADTAQGLEYILTDRLAGDIVHGVQGDTVTILFEFLEILLLPLIVIMSALSAVLANKMRKIK